MKLSRVHAGEWLSGGFGLLLLAGLILPWSDDSSALASPTLLALLLLLVSVAAILLPVVVASSRKTNVPVVCESLFWPFSALISLILVFKAILPPEPGFETGFWLAVVGVIGLTLALYRSVSREF